jgi:thiamine-phosphate pyrophosphorylase
MTPRPKTAEPRPKPRLYLITPPVDDADAFAGPLQAALDAGDVAAVLLRLPPGDQRAMINVATALAALVHAKDAALVLDGHADLVARAGADGAHLAGLAEFEASVGTLKPDRIAGAGSLDTRHAAMTAAEQGCDYVMFGEPDKSGERPAFDAVQERVTWWAEVFEAPCVAYAAAVGEVEPLVKAGADFIALGDWIWADPQTVSAKITDVSRYLVVPETVA